MLKSKITFRLDTSKVLVLIEKLLPSIIIFKPITVNNEKAIQCPIKLIASLNISPRKLPSNGIRPWNRPKRKAIKSARLSLSVFCNPHVMLTVKQSIDSAKPNRKASMKNPILNIINLFCYCYKILCTNLFRT